MTTKHTPGPWTATPFLTPANDDDPQGVYIVQPVERTLGKRYFEAEAESDELEQVHAENQANAVLIAAAPELLAALKHCLHYAETPGDFSQDEAFEMMGECANLLERIELPEEEEAA